MANLNWETGKHKQKTKYLREQRNINHFRDQKAENKFQSNIGNKETPANMLRKQGIPLRGGGGGGS